ncbi:hypothetical protein [Cetobacterium sp.]|uniref:hypothetical protein n=1 Tax=Cetobacterium sp. TaxID=2071632 RepID=UPI003EE6D669
MRNKVTDKEKALIIFEFLKTSEGFDKNDEVEKMESKILNELEKIKNENITPEELFKIQANLEQSIGDFKDMLRTKYFKYGILTNEFLNLKDSGRVEDIGINI